MCGRQLDNLINGIMHFFYCSSRKPKTRSLKFSALSVGSSMELGGGHCLIKPIRFWFSNLEIQGVPLNLGGQ